MLLSRTFRAVTAAAAMLGFVASAEATEITVLYSQPWLYKETHETIAAEFTKRHPDITVKFQAPMKNYEEVLTSVLRDSITGTVPDVAFVGTNLIHVLVARDLAASLDPFIKNEANWKDNGFIENMVATGRVNGHQYGMPFALSTPIMYMNADLVRQAGGNPDSPPKTWEEVFALAKKVNALGDGKKGMFIHWQTTGNYLWQAVLFSNGGKLLNPDGKTVAFNDAAGLKTFQLFAAMAKEAKMPNYTREQARQEFTAGLISMQFSSSAELTLVTKQIGDRFKLVTAPFPMPGPNPIVSGGGTSVMLTKDRAKQKAAWEYIKFTAGPIGQSIMAKATGYLPSSQKAIDTPELLGDYYRDHPNARTSLNQAKRATPWLGFPGDNGIKIIDTIYAAIESVLTGNATPEAALASTAARANELLAK